MRNQHTQNLPHLGVRLRNEPWRPRVHFTPEKNWINDPNGLVFFEGEYHLFYQYNPHGKDWGHMSWGHAVSQDLIHWQELPVAIPEQEFMVFSGCALVDWDNTSGLGDGKAPPLLAYFTAHYETAERQTQCLAFSHDRGRRWQMYDGNPIIDLDLEHFRDPNVFFHEDSEAWIMAVALPREHTVQIYRSTDLLNWSHASTFGPAGATGGQWECPALIEVPEAEATGLTRWVLKVDVDLNLIGEGSGAQYFVGEFDGYTFASYSDEAQIADYGSDFYAAITWSDLPDSHTHPVWIGWMSNHHSGRYYPTDPWRGAMTLPRELFVFKESDTWRLGQRPVNLYPEGRAATEFEDVSLLAGDSLQLMILPEGEALELNMDMFSVSGGKAELQLTDETGGGATIIWSKDTRQVTIDRGHGAGHASPVLHARSTAPMPARVDAAHMRIIIDASSVEIFVNGGQRVLTECLFPTGALKVELVATDMPARFEKISATRLG